jgi:RNA polymerase sigma-70 factor (ECF subfamily)
MSRILETAPEEASSRKPARNRPKGIQAKHGQQPAECRELFLNLSEYLDGRVEPIACEGMRGHIEAYPACIVFFRDLRMAIGRCRELEIPCDPAVAPRLRLILTQEYLRLAVCQRQNRFSLLRKEIAPSSLSFNKMVTVSSSNQGSCPDFSASTDEAKAF